jgi:hypothetical protein
MLIDGKEVLFGQVVLPFRHDGSSSLHVECRPGIFTFESPEPGGWQL